MFPTIAREVSKLALALTLTTNWPHIHSRIDFADCKERRGRMVFRARIALVVLLVAAPVGAQELPAQNVMPDKPAPRGNFLTRPFYDQQVTLLAEINAGAAIWDDVSSRKVIDRGGYERNPLIRPFVHNSGTLAAESVAEVWLMAFLADRMKHSSHSLLRKTWWLPQTINISAKVSGGIYNSVLLTR
jgi:hypothetical protein